MKRLILIILLAINSLNAQWQQVTNWPKGQRWLNSVYFIDSLYGWIVGNDNWIYHSTDGGQTWLERLNPTHSELNAVQFIDRKLGYTVGSPGGGWYGVFLKTTNGGQDWFNLTNPVQGAARDVVFLDSLNGWACGATTPLYHADTTGDNGGLVWKTTNAGNTWTYQKFGKPVFGFFHIQMLPNGNGWLLGPNELYTTTDFGFRWNKYNSLPLPAGFEYYQLALKGDKVYITVKSWTLWHSWLYLSADNGLSWQLLSILDGRPPAPNSLVVIDDNNLYIILLGGGYEILYRILKSTDGGRTWEVDFNKVANMDFLFAITMSSDMSLGWAVGTQIWRYTKPVNHPPILELGPIDTVAKAGTPFTVTYHAFDPDSGDKVTVSVEYPPWLKVDTLRKKITGLVPGELIDKKFVFKVTATDTKGASTSFISDSIAVRGVVKVDEFGSPTEFYLSLNYPNPFNPTTTIKFGLPNSEFVLLVIYDLLGREVTILVNEQKDAGYYKVDFNASNLPSGTYFYRLTAGSFTQIKKMTLIK